VETKRFGRSGSQLIDSSFIEHHGAGYTTAELETQWEIKYKAAEVIVAPLESQSMELIESRLIKKNHNDSIVSWVHSYVEEAQ